MTVSIGLPRYRGTAVLYDPYYMQSWVFTSDQTYPMVDGPMWTDEIINNVTLLRCALETYLRSRLVAQDLFDLV